MYFFVFLAHPKPSSEGYGTVDGAYVSCWVIDPLESSAETAARELIEQAGWDVDEREEAYPLAEGHYDAGDPGRDYYEQARADGICVVFHRWHVGAPDE